MDRISVDREAFKRLLVALNMNATNELTEFIMSRGLEETLETLTRQYNIMAKMEDALCPEEEKEFPGHFEHRFDYIRAQKDESKEKA